MTRLLSAFVLPIVLLAIAACNNGDGDSDSGPGSVTLAVTDSPTDDLDLFQVDVTGISLRHSNGSTVALLATPVRVDFASLGDLSEILGAVEVPSGGYAGGTITIDWSSAVALIVGQTSAATIVDVSGTQLIGAKTYEMNFPYSLWVGPRAHRLLQFDFNLDASLEVSGTQVIAAPTFLVDVDPASPKSLLLRGRVVSGDTASRSLAVSLMRPGGVEIDEVGCSTAEVTTFQLDGVPYAGAEGFNHLGEMPAGTWVQVYGVLDTATGVYTALDIEAGFGTIGGGTDLIEGVVTTRVGGPGSDATLTVLGSSFDASGNIISLDRSFIVQTSHATTKVIRRGYGTLSTMDDVNVGQEVRVFGDLTGTTTMNAVTAESVVSLLPTRISGMANGGPSGSEIEITLRKVFRRSIELFNFNVSGTPQADVSNFLVGFGGEASRVTESTPVEFIGNFPAVNTPGQGDFTAVTLVNIDAVAPWIHIRYTPASSTTLDFIHGLEIEIDRTGEASAILDRASAGTSALPASPTLKVQPRPEGLYLIWKDQSIHMYSSFFWFAYELYGQRADGAKLYALHTLGAYDAGTNTVQATNAMVVLQ